MGEIDWKALKQQADDATRPLEDGDYPVQVTKSEMKIATTGAPMIVVSLTVSGGPRAGRVLFNNFVFSPEKAFALKMWFDALGAFGIDDAVFSTGPSIEQIAQLLMGRSAIVTVGQKEYPAGSGVMRNECKSFKRGGAPGIPGSPMVGVSAGVPSGVPSASMPPVPSVSSSLPPIPQPAVSSSTPPTPAF